MSQNIRDYEFRTEPKEITYLDEEPLKLNKDFSFFHNKNKFRKELTRLQLIFKDYTGVSLLASGIRDSYLKGDYFDNFYIVIFTTNQFIRDANRIMDPNKDISLDSGCYYLESTSNYMLLLSKDMKGLIAGVDTMEDILNQTLKEYLEQKNAEEYLKVKPFKLLNCSD